MAVLEAKNITKVFPGVLALNSVNLSIDAGVVHCVIGENGSGKSTLIKCLTGIYEPEIGDVIIEGTNVKDNPLITSKIAYVPQEIDLFPDLTVAENLFLPYEKTGFTGLVHKRAVEKAAIPWLDRLHLSIKPDELVKNTTVSEQQLLQIGRALVRSDFSILLLDEPTTSLTTSDTEILFQLINELKEEGKAIVFISHKLEEIFSIGDVLTVLRNGDKVNMADVSSVDTAWVVQEMTGRAIDQEELFRSTNVRDEEVLRVDNISGSHFSDISFSLKAGEILGFTGLVGSGRSELMQAIFGYLPLYSGHVTLDKTSWKKGNTSHSTKHGFVYLPEERKTQGILQNLSVLKNISISVLEQLKFGLTISRKKERALGNDVVSEYQIKTPSLEQHIKFLSGGNQQKVIIGRAMSVKPKVIVFDEPTKGIDVGAKIEIYRVMKQLAEEEGMGIILISSELEEIMKCSNRIIALYQGRKVDEFPGDAAKDTLLAAIIGVNNHESK